jgi:hypothetical protein
MSIPTRPSDWARLFRMACSPGLLLYRHENLGPHDGSMGEWAKDASLPIETG